MITCGFARTFREGRVQVKRAKYHPQIFEGKSTLSTVTQRLELLGVDL